MRCIWWLALCFALSAVLSLSAAAQTETAVITIYPGDNWVSAPLVPIDPLPESVFGACINDVILTRFDVGTQQPVTYGDTAFGNILLADGYTIYNPTATTFTCSYEGVADGVPGGDGKMTDMWVALSGSQIDGVDAGGMHWIGHPFYHDTPLAACTITDGNIILSVAEAVSVGWVDGLWNSFDGATQMPFTIGVPGSGADDTILRPTCMYKVVTHRDNLALLVPAYPVPEPSSLAALLVGMGGIAGALRRRRR